MDARGTYPQNDYLKVTAPHIRVYNPPTGPEIGRITTPAYDGYNYINGYTPNGYVVVCGDGYKAVMSYTIRFYNGLTVSGSNFYTPTGTARWSYC